MEGGEGGFWGGRGEGSVEAFLEGAGFGVEEGAGLGVAWEMGLVGAFLLFKSPSSRSCLVGMWVGGRWWKKENGGEGYHGA